MPLYDPVQMSFWQRVGPKVSDYYRLVLKLVSVEAASLGEQQDASTYLEHSAPPVIPTIPANKTEYHGLGSFTRPFLPTPTLTTGPLPGFTSTATLHSSSAVPSYDLDSYISTGLALSALVSFFVAIILYLVVSSRLYRLRSQRDVGVLVAAAAIEADEASANQTAEIQAQEEQTKLEDDLIASKDELQKKLDGSNKDNESKAKEISELQEKLLELGNDWQTLKIDHDKLHTLNSSLLRCEDKKKSKHQKKTVLAEEKDLKNAQLEASLRSVQQELTKSRLESKAKIAALTEEKNSSQQDNEELRQEIQDRRQESYRVDKESAEKSSTLTDAQNQNNKLQAQIGELQRQAKSKDIAHAADPSQKTLALKDMQDAFNGLNGEKKDIEDALAAVNSKAQKKEADANRKITYLEAFNISLQTQLTAAESGKESLMAEYQDKLGEKQKEMEAWRSMAGSFERNEANIKVRADAQAIEIEQSAQEIANLKAEVQDKDKSILQLQHDLCSAKAALTLPKKTIEEQKSLINKQRDTIAQPKSQLEDEGADSDDEEPEESVNANCPTETKMTGEHHKKKKCRRRTREQQAASKIRHKHISTFITTRSKLLDSSAPPAEIHEAAEQHQSTMTLNALPENEEAKLLFPNVNEVTPEHDTIDAEAGDNHVLAAESIHTLVQQHQLPTESKALRNLSLPGQPPIGPRAMHTPPSSIRGRGQSMRATCEQVGRTTIWVGDAPFRPSNYGAESTGESEQVYAQSESDRSSHTDVLDTQSISSLNSTAPTSSADAPSHVKKKGTHPSNARKRENKKKGQLERQMALEH